MNAASIDLFSGIYWAVAGLGLVILTPLNRPAARRCAFALLNLAFIALYLGTYTLAVLAGVLLAHSTLRLFASGRLRPPAVALAAAAVLFLFLLHKLPQAAAEPGLLRWRQVLALIGFSYVALRLVDVGRDVAEGRQPPPGVPALINYLLPFHMLAAGPIQSYEDFAAQKGVPDALDAAGALSAIELIASGLFKKYVLANLIGQVFLTGFRVPGPYLLLEVQWQFLWLYLDFSAYSDIALGVGGLLGVATPVNFNRPLLARNIIEFWDRWHISLSAFIRRNIFIPLQIWLMRRTDGRRPLFVASAAFTVAFLLCGLWHGVSLRYLAWGGYQAVGLVVCNLYKAGLTRRLGRRQLPAYLANPWIRLASTVLTYEFFAFSLLIVLYPFEEISWWKPYRV